MGVVVPATHVAVAATDMPAVAVVVPSAGLLWSRGLERIRAIGVTTVSCKRAS